MKNNFILLTDTYKACSHHAMVKPGVKKIYSYLESRGGTFDKIFFFGLEYYLTKYFSSKVFDLDDIEEAYRMLRKHCPDGEFNYSEWVDLYSSYGGLLPVSISALDEGSIVKPGIPLLTIYNTDDRFPWLTNRLESLLLHIWYPITVASQSYEMLNFLKNFVPEDVASRMLIDFSYRGCSSDESASLAGAAHIAAGNTSTDNLPGLELLARIYDGDVAGYSVPATEHSVTTIWNSDDDTGFFRHCLKVFPKGIISLVVDTYDLYRAVRSFGQDKEIKQLISDRDGIVVVRPDSGCPLTQIPEIMTILGEYFPPSLDKDARIVINPKFKILWGDGINRKSLYNIVTELHKSYDIGNFLFGSGGGLAQDLNRDTCKIAFKTSAYLCDDGWYQAKKNPVTDHSKASKGGIFEVLQTEKGWEYRNDACIDWEDNFNLLKKKFHLSRDSRIQNYTNLDKIRMTTERTKNI